MATSRDIGCFLRLRFHSVIFFWLRSNLQSYHPGQKLSFLRVSQVSEFVGKENSPNEDVFDLSFEHKMWNIRSFFLKKFKDQKSIMMQFKKIKDRLYWL